MHINDSPLSMLEKSQIAKTCVRHESYETRDTWEHVRHDTTEVSVAREAREHLGCKGSRARTRVRTRHVKHGSRAQGTWDTRARTPRSTLCTRARKSWGMWGTWARNARELVRHEALHVLWNYISLKLHIVAKKPKYKTK